MVGLVHGLCGKRVGFGVGYTAQREYQFVLACGYVHSPDAVVFHIGHFGIGEGRQIAVAVIGCHALDAAIVDGQIIPVFPGVLDGQREFICCLAIPDRQYGRAVCAVA